MINNNITASDLIALMEQIWDDPGDERRDAKKIVRQLGAKKTGNTTVGDGLQWEVWLLPCGDKVAVHPHGKGICPSRHKYSAR